MSQSNTATLYLTKRNAWVVSPWETSRALLDQQWDGADASAIFQQISQALGITHLTVVFGHDLSYVFMVPQVASADDGDIWARIQENIPADVSEKSNAAWSIVADPTGSSAPMLQVLAVAPMHLQLIIAGALKTGIHVQAVTGIGVLLGAYAVGSTPQLLIWESLERLAVIAVSGAVYGITPLPMPVQTAFLQQQRSMAHAMWEIPLATIIIDDRTAPQIAEQVPKEFTVKNLIIDPFRYDPTRVSDPWKHVLALPKHMPKKPVQSEMQMKTGKPHTQRSHPSTVVIIGSFIIVILLISLWFVFNFRY